MVNIPGYASISEFAEKHNIPSGTVRNHLRAGYCKWPYKRHTRDGRCKHPLYKTWDSMIGRCYHKTNASYKSYGEKGIKVCARWREDFANFIEDMGDRPDPTYTLDRIDPEGDYTPTNCRWASIKTQALNTRRGVFSIEKHRSRWRIRSKSKYVQFYESFDTEEEARNKLKELREGYY